MPRWMTDAEVERVERLLDRIANRRGPAPTQAEWDLVDRALGELGHNRDLIAQLRARGPEVRRPKKVAERWCGYCGRPVVDERIEHASGCPWLRIEET